MFAILLVFLSSTPGKCLDEITRDDTGNYTWLVTEKNITQSLNCSTPVGSHATRSCTISDVYGAYWGDVRSDDCEILDQTSSSAKLQSLAKVGFGFLCFPDVNLLHTLQLKQY